MKYTAKDRFLRYVQIDTQANPYSDTVPSTAKQINLSRILSEELTGMGVQNELTEHGYVYARIPSNTSKSDVPSIFFCSHVDTAFDCSGTDVKPIVHANYQGQEIVLPDDNEQVISQAKFPELKNKIGHDVITASGLTLLGADDKSGVACIMDAVYNLVNNPDIKHGEVNVLFTTDEEIGRGVKYVDVSKIGAEFGYTLDSGDVGHFEYENFSADGAVLKIKGVSAHPGYAKGKMEHASRIAADILSQLPKDHLSPESTEGKEGFIHPNKIEGMLEEASIEFIIRSFETEKLAEYEALIENTAKKVLENYPGSSYTFEVHEQYRNMKDVVDKHMHIVDIAVKAMENAGIEPFIDSIRGGTDGSVLSHMGLPCPNIFSGQHGIHSKLEWTTVQDMQKATDTVMEIIKLVERR
ncbi:MAG: tripeptide aminopeptidase [Saprospiraceae bacterium]|jgi:tripeptide aminopeptidase